jgi:cbb3-type cytochrome oxidase subunit 3
LLGFRANRDTNRETNPEHHEITMETIWGIISVFGLVSMLLLVVGIWTHLDLRKKQREEEDAAAKKPEPKP